MEEDPLNRRTYGILAGVIGSAIGAWWYVRNRRANEVEQSRGTVIYNNTPTATGLSEGLI